MEQPSLPERDKVNVFISSTYAELIPFRLAAFDAVWRSDSKPVAMERMMVALPVNKYESSHELLKQSQVYVGIFSQRYGEVTAQEFAWAEKENLPILIFWSTHQLNDLDVETDPERAAALAALKQRLYKDYVVGEFTTLEELGEKVYRSLVLLRDSGRVEIPVLGTRTDDKANIPTPPLPYVAHAYILGEGGFVGRREELDRLDAWVVDRQHPLLLVDAIGGAGKSALAWEWTRSRARGMLPNADGVMWWSFYEGGATMASFLAHAVAYLCSLPLDDCKKMPRADLEERLLDRLRAKPALLVLDGVERLLVAYARLNAAQLSEAEVEKDKSPTRCVDPRDGALLRQLAQCAGSKLLLTTRLIPDDLLDRDGQLITGVRVRELPGLSAADALELFEQAGVHGTAAVMRNFLARFGDHALLVKVLAGRIAQYRPAPGKFNAWYEAEGKDLKLDQGDLVARQNSILAAGLADLDPRVFELLCRLAAFRYPVEYAAVVAINPFAPPSSIGSKNTPPSEEVRAESLGRLHAALAELEARGLVKWERQHNRYDLHPVVRAYAYARLSDKTQVYGSIRDYFERQPAENVNQAQEVGDLRRTLEIYHALLGASQFQAAINLYYARLGKVLLLQMGAYQTMIELLSPLFRAGFDAPPALSRVDYQTYAANALAQAFQFLSDLDPARTLYALNIPFFLGERDAENSATGLKNLGIVLQEIGTLAQAERAFQLSLSLSEAVGDHVRTRSVQQSLLGVAALRGAWAEGEATLAAVQASLDDDFKGWPWMRLFAAQLRFGEGQDPSRLLAHALTSAQEQRFPRAERDIQQLTGEVALARGDLAGAEVAWLAAHSIAQRQGIPLGPYLADLARLRARQWQAGLGDADRARELIAEALRAGGVGPIDLAAAEVYQILGDTELAKQYIEPAYRRSWADGPPYAFFFELGRVRAVLKALGMPEPTLPPYDPARIPPLPHETEIRAFIAELEAKNAKPDEGQSYPELAAVPAKPASAEPASAPSAATTSTDQTRREPATVPAHPDMPSTSRQSFWQRLFGRRG